MWESSDDNMRWHFRGKAILPWVWSKRLRCGGEGTHIHLALCRLDTRGEQKTGIRMGGHSLYELGWLFLFGFFGAAYYINLACFLCRRNVPPNANMNKIR